MSRKRLHSNRFFFQLFGLVVCRQRLDYRSEPTIHHDVELMECQPDAVIGDAVFFEVVGANFF